MANKIQVKRGNKNKLPILSAGEPAFVLDTKEFFIGSSSGNIKLIGENDVINDLETGGTNKALSAEQGKKIDITLNKVDILNQDSIKMQKSTKRQMFKDMPPYMEDFNLNLSFNSYQIDSNGQVISPNNGSKIRIITPIFYLDRDTTFTLANDSVLWTSLKCATSSGAGAVWDKKYTDGKTYTLKKGYNAIVFKHITEGNFIDEDLTLIRLRKHIDIYNDRVEVLKDKILSYASGYDLIFPFMTDIHHFPTTDLKYGGNPNNMNIRHIRGLYSFTNNFDVDFTLIGGDVSFDWTTMDKMKTYIKDVTTECERNASPVVIMGGNHDFGDAYNFGKTGVDSVLSPAQLNLLFNKNNSNTLYFYRDYPDIKTRIIFINTSDSYILQANGTTKYNRCVDETSHVIGREQAVWLSDVALNTKEDDWNIIFASHVPIRNDTVNNRITKNSVAVANIINARKNKTNLILSNTDPNPDFSITLNRNYSSYKSCNIVAWICGHTHTDTITDFNGIKVVTTTLAMGTEAGWGLGDNTDYTKTTFDVFCLDTKNRKLDIKRFGTIGSDRTINY